MVVRGPRPVRHIAGQIAGKQDGDDLPAAIAEVLVAARQSGEDAVNGAGAVALFLDHGAGRDPFPGMDQFPKRGAFGQGQSRHRLKPADQGVGGRRRRFAVRLGDRRP